MDWKVYGQEALLGVLRAGRKYRLNTRIVMRGGHICIQAVQWSDVMKS
jgi:hypothetical protein